ncbi:MAG: hypothetical protein WAM91_00045 [Candidatus Acidiferrales bacterium]
MITAALLFGIAAGSALGKLKLSGKQDSASQNAQAQHELERARFLASLPPGFQVPPESDVVGTRLLAYYGAVFVARGGVTPPPVLVFADEDAVTNWQAGLISAKTTINKTVVELQSVALGAFVAARTEAQARNLDITPRGTDPAKRDYQETIKWWKSRVEPGLDHWVAAGKLLIKDARRIRNLPPAGQVPEIFRLEESGLFFSGNFSRSILSSVAPPGGSQHISMLAMDIKEDDSAAVRAILAKHCWYQTVLLDTPHFTYLGVSEQELPALGLRKVNLAGREYWIPDLGISVDKLLGRRAPLAFNGGRNN